MIVRVTFQKYTYMLQWKLLINALETQFDNLGQSVAFEGRKNLNLHNSIKILLLLLWTVSYGKPLFKLVLHIKEILCADLSIIMVKVWGGLKGG